MYRLVATVKSVKGHCTARHKVGDIFELSYHKSNGLCGGFYHDIFPSICVYQFGGTYPWFPDQDVFLATCADKMNEVTLEVKRIRKTK